MPLTIDPLKYAKAEEPKGGTGGVRFELDGDVIYPLMVKELQRKDSSSGTADARKYNSLISKARELISNSAVLADVMMEPTTKETEQEQEVLVGGTMLPDKSVVGGKREKRIVKTKVPVMPAEVLPVERLTNRAIVLEIARKWFTNELHYAVDSAPMELHWVGRPRWRIGLPSHVLEDLERTL